jgi:hypothetical protein
VNQLKSTRSLRIGALVLVICALGGLGVFGLLAWRAVTIEDATRADAERRIASVRAGISLKAPLVEIDDEGRVVRMASTSDATGRPIARLRGLAWRAVDRRLVSVDSPFWFVRLKGPAATFVLEDTGMDLERLGLTGCSGPSLQEPFGPPSSGHRVTRGRMRTWNSRWSYSSAAERAAISRWCSSASYSWS